MNRGVLLVLAILALCANACTAVLMLPTPVTKRPYSFEARDASIFARLDEVQVRLDPHASTETFGDRWDRYVMTVGNLGPVPVTISRISLRGPGEDEVPLPGVMPSQVPAGQAAAGTVAVVAGAATTAVGASALPAAALAGSAAPVGVLIGGAALIGLGYDSLRENIAERTREKRFAAARAQFPLFLEPGTHKRVDLWYPRTPHPSAIEVHYAASEPGVLVADTRELLADAHYGDIAIPIAHPQGECPPEAAAAGVTHGTVKARLRVDARGRVQGVLITSSTPRGVFDQEAQRTFFNLWSFTVGDPAREADAEVRFNCEDAGRG